MHNSSYEFLNNALIKRKQDNSLRKLKQENNLIDFCSNDYLGYARCEELKEKIKNYKIESPNLFGSTGSRMISGNYKFTEELEKQIAKFHSAKAGLIFNSGFDANIGLLSCVPQRGDTIIFDELAHASIRDGVRLSNANSFSFEHNNISDLEKKNKKFERKYFCCCRIGLFYGWRLCKA